ncbi:MAG TPA: hypothetical protein VGM10_09695 [Actinocrinis sp.]
MDAGLSVAPARLDHFGRLAWVVPAWAAAVGAMLLAVAELVLNALGADSLAALALEPDILGYSCIGCLLLTRRPGHPMGPLLCLIGLTTAMSDLPFVYERYVLTHPSGSLPFPTAMLWANTWAFALPASLGGFVLPLVFPLSDSLV